MEIGEGGLGGGAGGLAIAADAAEEIDLPIEIEGEVEDVVGAGKGLGVEDEGGAAGGAGAGAGGAGGGGDGEGVVANELAALEGGGIGEALTNGVGLGVEIGEEIGGGDADLRAELADAIDGEGDVLIGGDGLDLDPVEDGVAEDFPPIGARGGVAGLGFFPGGVFVGGGDLDDGSALVIGTDGGKAGEGGEREGEEAKPAQCG